MQKVTKLQQVKEHLIKKGNISSLVAIEKYSATRLSAIIFNLRKQGYDITTTPMKIKDRNGNDCTYGLYKLISSPETSALNKKATK